MTPNTVHAAMAVAQLAPLPRERAGAGDAGEAASFAATLGVALASSVDAQPSEAQQAPGARSGARSTAAKDDRHDKAEDNLLAALLALGALPIAVPADVAPQARQPAEGTGTGTAAAPAAAVLDGLPAPAALTALTGSDAVDATQVQDGTQPSLTPGTELVQTGRPAATALQAMPARFDAAQADLAQADAAQAIDASKAPAPDAATARDRPAADPLALRVLDGQPRPTQPAADATSLAQARTTDGTTQAVSALGAAPDARNGATGNPGDSPRGDDPRDAAPVATRAADAASRTASPPVQVALARPAGADRDQHARESSDASGPAAPATGALSAPASADPPRPGAIAAQVAPPVGSEQWPAALSQQVLRVGGGREVELNLNPVELGPLKVKLTLADGQAQVMFVSEHASVRQAIEAAIPQLRSSFADNGISLGQATVGSGSGDAAARQPQDQPAQRQPRNFEAQAQQPGEPSRAPLAAGGRRPASAVDTFA